MERFWIFQLRTIVYLDIKVLKIVYDSHLIAGRTDKRLLPTA